jgi:hypothetical protein
LCPRKEVKNSFIGSGLGINAAVYNISPGPYLEAVINFSENLVHELGLRTNC